MRKTLFFALSLLCLMLFVGCNAKQPNQSYNYNKQNVNQIEDTDLENIQSEEVVYAENDDSYDEDVIRYCDYDSCDRHYRHSHDFNGRCNRENACCEYCTFDSDCTCGCDNCYYREYHSRRNYNRNHYNNRRGHHYDAHH